MNEIDKLKAQREWHDMAAEALLKAATKELRAAARIDRRLESIPIHLPRAMRKARSPR